MWYTCSYRGGGISNSKVITEEGKYALDAVQNNPNIEGTLSSKIEKLETTSPIAVKNIVLQNVQIDTKSGGGLYYKKIDNFFADNGIDVNKVVGVNAGGWGSTSYIFNIYISEDVNGIGFMSQTSQTIGTVRVRVTYLK